MLICGVDPGLHVTGYGLVLASGPRVALKGAGYIRTSPKDPLPERLFKIHEALARVIDAQKPDVLVLEKLFAHHEHPVTATLLGHARGVICMLAMEKKIRYFEYPATRIKKAVTGRGHATKEQVQRLVEHSCGLDKDSLGPVDVTDAIAVAMTHALAETTGKVTRHRG
jgi:crossover junction endodeoxyribonuclease RuvC